MTEEEFKKTRCYANYVEVVGDEPDEEFIELVTTPGLKVSLVQEIDRWAAWTFPDPDDYGISIEVAKTKEEILATCNEMGWVITSWRKDDGEP